MRSMTDDPEPARQEPEEPLVRATAAEGDVHSAAGFLHAGGNLDQGEAQPRFSLSPLPA